jgi:hypothetical protein
VTGHGCLANAEQFNAWTCNVAGPPIVLQMNYNPAHPSATMWDLIVSQFPDNVTYYGASQPQFKIPSVKIVQDLVDPDRGPALHFQAMYDKKVIVPYNLLTADDGSNARIKREAWAAAQAQVKPGDKPWICYWNDTWIEGFIYQQNSTFTDVSSTTPASTSSVPTSDSYSSHPYESSSDVYNAQMATRSKSAPAPTPTDGSGAAEEEVYSLRSERVTKRTPVNIVPRIDNLQTSRGYYNTIQPLPRAIKLEESRYPDPDQNPAYCQRFQYLDNHLWAPLQEHVTLHEQLPGPPQDSEDDQDDDDHGVYKRAIAWLYQNQAEGPDYNCRCQWGGDT